MCGIVVLVTRVGDAEGSLAAAAALACAGSDPDRAGLLIDLGGRRPRPALLASTAARKLEERLAAHLPEAPLASRGQVCHLSLPADGNGIARLPAALPLARDAIAVVHLPPGLLRAVLGESAIQASGVLLRADLKSGPRPHRARRSRLARPWPDRRRPQASARLGPGPPRSLRPSPARRRRRASSGFDEAAVESLKI
jgi:hypothetical protein